MGLEINIDRLIEDIEELSQIGRLENGGVSRPSFSEADREARTWLVNKIKEAQLDLFVDSVGNIFGRIHGKGPAVISGSHLDTIPNGGKYDGALGVLCALECCRVIKEDNLNTISPIEMVTFTDEEERFFFGLGSLAFTGQLDIDQAYAAQDANGIALAEVMAQTGLDIKTIGNARRTPRDVKAFIELHIEQGPILEYERISVGVVDAVKGNYRYGVKIEGRTDHAGRPMKDRRDACLGAVLLVRDIKEALKQINSDGDTLMTVGIFEVQPGLANIVPGMTYFSLDFRDTNIEILKEIESNLTKRAKNIAYQFNLEVAIEEILIIEPVHFSKEIQNILKQVSNELGIKWQRISSGAGHDAQIVAQVIPTAMIFVPSQQGRSHCPEEFTEKKDIEHGANVLLHTLLRLAT